MINLSVTKIKEKKWSFVSKMNKSAPIGPPVFLLYNLRLWFEGKRPGSAYIRTVGGSFGRAGLTSNGKFLNFQPNFYNVNKFEQNTNTTWDVGKAHIQRNSM